MRQYLILFAFLTLIPGSCEKDELVIDRDGNIYQTIQIGTQVWFAENLKTTKYNDGENIQLVLDGSAWAAETVGSYCFYNNDPDTYKDTYGALYNWYAVKDDKLCPKGWHVPSIDDWRTLVNYLGTDSIAGGKLKEAGFLNWISPNQGATNETGFTAKGVGFRFYLNGEYRKINIDTYIWSKSEAALTTGYRLGLSYITKRALLSTSTKPHGFSVRCIKD